MANKNDSRVTAKYTTSNIILGGRLEEEIWNQTQVIRIEKSIKTGEIISFLSTEVRLLWSVDFLFISYVAPYCELVMFEPAIFEGKRVGLWDRDVVEVFINSDSSRINYYSEYEVAPTGEKIDLMLDLPERDFLWSSNFEAAVHLDTAAKIWTTKMRIPFSAFGVVEPLVGMCWRINFYRNAITERVFLGWQPTMNDSAHKPEHFGTLEFVK
jgi:hypothetical protein